jgi:hypothetical protein
MGVAKVLIKFLPRALSNKCDGIILKEWEKISMDEIRARIWKMPERCERVAKDEAAMKSELW